MKALIVDDEKSARITMAAMLDEYCPNVHVVGEAATVQEAHQLITDQNPELVLLDIKIGSESGFDLLSIVENRNFSVVFTTAYDHFALKAIKFSATDYLLKPIDPDELMTAIDRAENSLLNPRQQMKVLMEHVENGDGQHKNIVLPIAGGFHLAQIADIIHIEADRNYCIFYLEDQQRIVVSKTLKEFDDLLSRLGFIRIHQSHLVNKKHIQGFKGNGRAGVLEMKNGKKLEVARSKKSEIIQFFREQEL